MTFDSAKHPVGLGRWACIITLSRQQKVSVTTTNGGSRGTNRPPCRNVGFAEDRLRQTFKGGVYGQRTWEPSSVARCRFISTVEGGVEGEAEKTQTTVPIIYIYISTPQYTTYLRIFLCRAIYMLSVTSSSLQMDTGCSLRHTTARTFSIIDSSSNMFVLKCNTGNTCCVHAACRAYPSQQAYPPLLIYESTRTRVGIHQNLMFFPPILWSDTMHTYL